MSINHLTTSQLQAILGSRGVELPATTQPLDAYVELATQNGITEVPLVELASLRKPPPAPAHPSGGGGVGVGSGTTTSARVLLERLLLLLRDPRAGRRSRGRRRQGTTAKSAKSAMPTIM